MKIDHFSQNVSSYNCKLKDEESNIPINCEDNLNHLNKKNILNKEKQNENEYNYIILLKNKFLKFTSYIINDKELFIYIYEMITNKNDIRKEQMKLTLFSINRCIDFFNDFIFLIKIFYTIYFNSQNKSFEKFIFLWYTFFFVTSIFTFYLRKYYILNLVPKNHNNLFSLFKVFKNIKSIDQNNLCILYYYDKLHKTYIFINKFFEDIPQFLLCFLYMVTGNKKDKFLFFNLFYSMFIFIINTIDVGLNIPITRILHFFFSTYIIDDSFIEYDSAPTNKNFCLYSFFVFLLWSIIALSSTQFVNFFWLPFLYVQFLMVLSISIIFLTYFCYFSINEDEYLCLNKYISI